MAAIDTTRVVPFGAITLHKVVRAADSQLAALRDWNDLRRTRKALSSLSDRELADIGMIRNDIESLSNRPF